MNISKKILGIGSALVAAVALSATLATAQAQPRYHHRDRAYECRMQVDRAEARLDRAIRRHGRHSYQARERRRDLRHIRERCRRYLHHRR